MDGSDSTSSYYIDIAHRANKMGVCIDINSINLSTNSVTIGTNKFGVVSKYSGGVLQYYIESDINNIPQDLFRRISSDSLCFNTVLRIRTSENFKAKHSFDRLVADPNVDNLYYIPSVDRFSSYSFDFDFTSSSGFDSYNTGAPFVQTAFKYNRYDRDSNTIKTYLRVMNQQYNYSSSPVDLYANANTDVILALLVNKLLRHCKVEGIEETRHLVNDWLVIVLADYNISLHDKNVKLSSTSIDTTFAKFPNLKHLSRLIFGLLNNTILKNPTFDDYWYYNDHLYSGLPPKLLRACIYPNLSSYGAINHLSSQHLHLNFAAITTSSCKIFLLDNYHNLYVYYYSKDMSSPDFSWPLPKDSKQ